MDLSEAIATVNKKYGSLSVLTLDSTSVNKDVDVIPTGSLALDLALGVGGIPRGRISEIYGPESSGKTTLCQHVVANAQKMGLPTLYIDMEHAIDPKYLQRTGVDTGTLLLSQPDTGNQALVIAEDMIKMGAVGLIVIDSVSALIPETEANDADMGDSVMGMQARLMSQALRKISPALKRSNTALVFTNQIRYKIGVVYGNPETTSGGNALKFYSSVRLEVRRAEYIKNKDAVAGIVSRVKIVKNKLAAPFKTATFEIHYPNGIYAPTDLLAVGVMCGIITKRGAFYYFNDERLGQGKTYAAEAITPEIEKDIRERALASLKNGAAIVEDDYDDTADGEEL